MFLLSWILTYLILLQVITSAAISETQSHYTTINHQIKNTQLSVKTSKKPTTTVSTISPGCAPASSVPPINAIRIACDFVNIPNLTKCQKTSRLTSYGYTNDKAQTIPTELRFLTNAKELTIQKVLTGSIPSTLSCLTNLIKLEISSVDDFLTGSIPDSLSRLTKLSSLLLKSQRIKGPIPTSISQMTALTSLSISHTQSPEYIPSSLQYLTNLKSLKLSHGFMGTIPSFLAKLGKLTSLDLGLNQLNGTIPRILSSMTNMISLSLRVNQLEGALPPSLSKLSRLQRLFLDGNTLEGEIPIAILNMTLAEVWLSGNKLTAFIDYYEDFNFCYILNGGRWYVDCGPVECSCCLSASNIECSVGRRLR